MLHVLHETVSMAQRAFLLCGRRQRVLLLVAVMLMALTGALATVSPIVVGALVDDMLRTTYMNFGPAVPYLAVIVVTVMVKELLTVVRKWIVEDTATRLQQQQTTSLVAHLLRIDLSFFARHRSGALNGRVHRSVEGLIRLLKLGFLDFCPAAFMAACALAVAMWREPVVGGIMAGGILSGFGLILWQVASQRGVRIDLLREREAMDGTVVEVLGGIETVRAANAGDIEAGRVDEVAERLRRREIRHHIQMALFDAAKLLTESLFHIAVLSVSVWFAIRGLISVGEVLTFSMLYLNVAAPLRELHRIVDEAHESTLRVLDLFSLYASPPDRSFLLESGCMPMTTRMPATGPVLELSHIRFSYPGSNGSGPTLDDFNLTINAGECVGVVGRTGCGKSTVSKLALRLMHTDSGTIRFRGVPIECVSREVIASQVGYVAQSGFLFSGSIADNIAYGRGKVTQADIEVAARRAGIHDEVVHELGGYAARLAERGSNISGGQRQRLLLARLFLHDPPLLVLDEATSALDNRTEAVVQEALDELMIGRTTLVIAHRLHTLRNVDRIIVMDAGKIVEEGTYSDLLSASGQFAELHRSTAVR
ncbi:MAG: ATP-binding cassette domain-containing protein [Phycisphaera sp.]|nr:ATP-binding cassette domain-containing protein [Phycisphaera sp.]